MDRIAPWIQAHWDYRAAGNFIAGGTGSGLAIFAAFAALGEDGGRPLAFVVAACLIVAGLGLVWLEIGRPWRFLHVFFNPRTSWMTRESLVAPVLLAAIAAAASFGDAAAIAAAALLAAAFLYCQARILRASTGIPAWREPRIVPLMVATGLAEGAGAFLVLVPADSIAVAAALVLVGLRWLAWESYCARLASGVSAQGARRALQAAAKPFLLLGAIAPVSLLLMSFAWPSARPVLTLAGGLACVAGGWFLKYAIVIRASFNQGFSLPHLPGRGAGKATPQMRPG